MVTVSKFKKSKNDGSSVTINNNSRGYSNTNNYSNVNTSGLDRMLWNIHDTGQDIDDPLTLPSLTVNGHIQAGTIDASGYINSLTGMTAPYGNFTDLWSNTGHIGYVYSDYIQTTDLKVTHTADIENIISRNISTENLTVTKSAHFAELIIDKIKSVGGAAIFSPADGFKIESEDDIIRIYDARGNETNYWMLCWDADDDRGRTINMWTEGDQAICQNFNEANEGKNYDISNTYFWMLVFGAGTYDPDPESSQHADIQYHAASSALYYEQGHTKPYAYNADKSKITFDTVKHYIIVYNYGSTFTDALGHEAPVRDGLFEPKAGNEIVMMGHRPWAREFAHKAGDAPSDPIPIDEEHFTEKERQSAIYISAYHSNIDTDLVAPLIAQYEGINDFTISDKRTTWFAAGNNAINGYANQITGNLRSYSGKSIDDMTEATIYYIMTDKSYISVDNTWGVTAGSKMNISCMYIQGNNTGYAGTKDSNIRLFVYYGYNSQSRPNMYYDTDIDKPLQIDLDKYYSGHLDTLTLQIERYNGTDHDILAVLSVPVIPEAGGQPGADGDDGEMYKLIKLNELAQVDVDGNFGIYLRYRVDHIIGANSTPVTSDSIYKIRFKTDKAGESYKILDFSNGIYTYDKDGGQDGYYEINVFGTDLDLHNLLDYRYLTVELYNSTTGTVMDTSVIPITLLAGAMFSITDVITSRVTDSEQNITYLQRDVNGFDGRITTTYNMASQALQTANGFENRVSRIETDMTTYSSYFDEVSYISEIREDNSYLLQYADSINSRVSEQITRFENGYSYITSNYSTIDQTAEQISLYVNSYGVSQDQLRRTGIDITSYNITLNGDTIINGQLDLNSTDGFNLHDDTGKTSVIIHGDEIPTLADWRTSTTNDLVKSGGIMLANSGNSSDVLDVEFNIDLGYRLSTDIMTFTEIKLDSTYNINTSDYNNITIEIEAENDPNSNITLTGTFTSKIAKNGYYEYVISLNRTFTPVSDNYIGTVSFMGTGSENTNFNRQNITVFLKYNIKNNNIVEIGANGIAAKYVNNGVGYYNYLGNKELEILHGQGVNTEGVISNNYGGGMKITEDGLQYYNLGNWYNVNDRIFNIITPSTGSGNVNYTVTKYDNVIILDNIQNNGNYNLYFNDSGGYRKGQVVTFRMIRGTGRVINISGSKFYISYSQGIDYVTNYTFSDTDIAKSFIYDGDGMWILIGGLT